MALQDVIEEINVINELFINYIYLNKNITELKEIKTTILQLIKNLKTYNRNSLINHYLENLLNYLFKINKRIIKVDMNIKYSLKQNQQLFILIKNYIINNEIEKLENLLNENVINFSQLYEYEQNMALSLLVIAIEANNLRAVKMLVSLKINVNLEFENLENEKSTPLLTAVNLNNFEIAKYLLDNGANCNFVDDDNINILSKSVNNFSFFKDLINKYDADINLPILYGSILHYACEAFSKDAILFLLDKGADITSLDSDNSTPLHILISERIIENYSQLADSIEVIKNLIERNIDIDAQNNAGWTALHYAVKIGQPEYVKVLLENNANLKIRNNCGKTAEDIARDYDDHEIVTIINEFNS